MTMLLELRRACNQREGERETERERQRERDRERGRDRQKDRQADTTGTVRITLTMLEERGHGTDEMIVADTRTSGRRRQSCNNHNDLHNI